MRIELSWFFLSSFFARALGGERRNVAARRKLGAEVAVALESFFGCVVVQLVEARIFALAGGDYRLSITVTDGAVFPDAERTELWNPLRITIINHAAQTASD